MPKGEFKNKRLHELLSAINFWLEKTDKELITQETLIEHIEKNHPSVSISKGAPHLSAISPGIAEKVRIAFVGETPEPYKDLRKHIYLKFPHRGTFYIKSDIEDKLSPEERKGLGGRLWIKIVTSPSGTTDLINYEKQMLFQWNNEPLYKMEDYAEACKKDYHAVEIDFEKFKAAGRGNRVALDDKVPEIGGKPVDFTEGLVSADGKK